ncbi:HdeD family acid-resistance protein [Bifidobacterium sp. 82T10]|uniref:HdeD family acid-resistance protein n=1 Tax=Bifidobacterium miconis TaxID=2834435 RepID=A0ABS6WCR5_9BIFI|nr:HdeD family acid-resistance protein [Bifidobacterium miconis]MBW3091830.1 HdeD family acid-resistance protein [Bifidobacterium miconis]
MSDPNANGVNINGQNGGEPNGNGQPEYGAYAPNGQPTNQDYPYGGNPNNPNNAGNASGADGQNPYGQYQPNGQNGNPYGQQNQAYGQPFAYQPFGQNPNQQDPNAYWQQFGQGGQPGQQFSPFKLIEELLPQKAKNTIRGLYGIIGAAAVILGIALLVWPGKTLTVFAVAFGIYFVVSGVIRIVSALVTLGLPGGWRVLDVLVGILLAFGGVVMLKNAALSGTSLAVFVTLIVGFGWIMEGVMALAESWRLPKSGWAVCYAIVSIIAGIAVILSPVSSMVFLVILGGCALVVMGVSAIVRAFTFGKPAKNGK